MRGNSEVFKMKSLFSILLLISAQFAPAIAHAAAPSCQAQAIQNAREAFGRDLGYSNTDAQDLWVLSVNRLVKVKVEIQHHDGANQVYTIVVSDEGGKAVSRAIELAREKFARENGYSDAGAQDIWVLSTEKLSGDARSADYEIELQHHDGGYKVYTIHVENCSN